MEQLDQLVTLDDAERLAEKLVSPEAWGYIAGGAGDERTLRWNREAFSRYRLRYRVLIDVSDVSTETTVLGTPISMPIIVAPMAYQQIAHEEHELGTARGAATAGTLMCLSTIATATPADVAAAAPGAPRWFQLYVFRDWGLTSALVQQAVDAGYSALVLTADTPYLGRREGPLRTGFAIPDDVRIPAVDDARGALEPFELHEHFALFSPAVSWHDVERLATASRLPVVVKGVLTAEDARLACEHGAAAVVVSNHGGRQLDGVPATLDALPEVAEAVGGRIEVYLDGGIRRGTDAVKALALGARAVLSGRAVVWGLATGGQEGARHVLELLREEIRLSLSLLGCTRPEEVSRTHVARAP